MTNSKNILLIGNCGSGKTWVMKTIIETFKVEKGYKIGKFYYLGNDVLSVIGKYDNSKFEGSDRLSMAVLTDLSPFLEYNKDKIIIAEGDRFTNSTYITKANPIIVKILDDGFSGRLKRNSTQTDRHIKSITTRVKNIKAHYEVSNSNEAYDLITKLIISYDKN